MSPVFDLTDVPSEIPLPEAGKHTVEVVKIEAKPPKDRPDSDERVLHVLMRYLDTGDELTDGQLITDYICLWKGFGKTRLRQLAIAAGLSVDGPIDTEDLIGCTLVVNTKEDTYNDEPTRKVASYDWK